MKKTNKRKRRWSMLCLVLALVITASALTACSCSGSFRETIERIRDRNQQASKSSEDEDEESGRTSSRDKDQDESQDKDEDQDSSRDESSDRNESSDRDRDESSNREESSRDRESSEPEEIIHREDPAQCKEILSAFLDAYKNQDPAAAGFLLNGGSEGLSYNGFQGLLASSFTYEIGNVDMSYTVPYVMVSITNVDFKQILETYLESLDTEAATSSDAIVQALEDLVNASDRPMRTFECAVPVYYLEEEEGMKIEMTEDLSNALTGGFAEFISNYLWSAEEESSAAQESSASQDSH